MEEKYDNCQSVFDEYESGCILYNINTYSNNVIL